MAELNKYELLIAERLQALPVPDLADSIWTRIENQLDIDMPTDDGPVPGGGGTPIVPRLTWAAAIFLIAMIAVYMVKRNEPAITPKSNKRVEQPSQQSVAPVISDPTFTTPSNNPPTITKGEIPRTVTPVVHDSIAFPPASILPEPITGEAVSPQIVRPDSVEITRAPIVNPDTSAGRKKRGVPGIKDSDYRIVPKKGN